MKELDDFTVERLERIAERTSGIMPTMREIAALARIALAAKTAEPSHYVVTKEYTDAYGPDVERSVYVTGLDASKHKADHGGDIAALYAAPTLNSPELPDGWRLMPIAPTPEMEQAISDGIYNDLYTTGIYADLLAAAPAPPTTEK